MNTSINGTMTREATAKYLNVSLPTLDAYLHRKENPIPAIKAGRKYLIPCSMLESWLNAEAVRNMSSMSNMANGEGATNE